MFKILEKTNTPVECRKCKHCVNPHFQDGFLCDEHLAFYRTDQQDCTEFLPIKK